MLVKNLYNTQKLTYIMPKKNRLAWIVAVDMGYGHQRAAYPLKDVAYERIINSNSDKLISSKEKKLWKSMQNIYEYVSKGYNKDYRRIFYKMFYKISNISPYYPYRDLSKPTFVVNYVDNLIKKGLGKSSVDITLNNKNIPFVSTFFVPAIAASYSKVKNVYCIVTDVDINRVWVPKDPKKNKITYLVPTDHTQKRLISYGVPKDRIFLTGFPLPKENLGGKDLKILKQDLGNRLSNLDPNRSFIITYRDLIKKNLGSNNYKKKSDHILTITFVVGGAGAQVDIAVEIIKSLKNKILKKEIIFNFIAGIRIDVKTSFEQSINKIGLTKSIGKNLNIIFSMEKKEYFERFNQVLRKTDILWTKPSELSFYSGLGLPIILTPAIGPHEEYNRKWLHNIGAGHMQEDPKYTGEWLFEWLESGMLAESAWKGFLEAPKLGIYNIEDVLFNKKKKNYFEL